MKKQVLTLVSVLGLLLAAGSAFAQSSSVKANVPFSFMVNHTTMPAGTYTISAVGLGGTLVFRGLDNNAIQLANANYAETGSPSKSTKLVFHRYGSRYFLSQIWTEGNNRGRQLPKGEAESEIAMDYTPTNVILTASLR